MNRLGAIDCGTNSLRLLIAEPDPAHEGTLRDVRREMRIVRLGKGVDAGGRLDPQAIERTRAVLADYAGMLQEAGAKRVRMVATSATRDASNRDEFFSMVRTTLGTDAEVITGQEEARLSFEGAVADLPAADTPIVVTDVGGGSTEVVAGRWDGSSAVVEHASSVDVGCVRITERCLHSDPPGAAEIAEARDVIGAALDEAFRVVPVSAGARWVGVAGTVTTLDAMAQRLPAYSAARIHGHALPLDRLRAVTAELLASDSATRAANPVIHPGRVDVMPGGALVVDALAQRLGERAGVRELISSEKDILDGIALSLT